MKLDRNAIALSAVAMVIVSPVVVCTALFATADGPGTGISSPYGGPSSIEMAR